jgi:hypothetical protein
MGNSWLQKSKTSSFMFSYFLVESEIRKIKKPDTGYKKSILDPQYCDLELPRPPPPHPRPCTDFFHSLWSTSSLSVNFL